MPLRIATWNVNSLRQRLDHLARFAAEVAPDVICLQETKVTDELFPREAIQEIGYPHLLIHGQKGYNGVAILSRLAFQSQETKVWCGKDDRRHAAVTVECGSGVIELHNFYVPSGGLDAGPGGQRQVRPQAPIPARDGRLGAADPACRRGPRSWSATSTWRPWRPTFGTTSAYCAASATPRWRASTLRA